MNDTIFSLYVLRTITQMHLNLVDKAYETTLANSEVYEYIQDLRNRRDCITEWVTSVNSQLKTLIKALENPNDAFALEAIAFKTLPSEFCDLILGEINDQLRTEIAKPIPKDLEELYKAIYNQTAYDDIEYIMALHLLEF